MDFVDNWRGNSKYTCLRNQYKKATRRAPEGADSRRKTNENPRELQMLLEINEKVHVVIRRTFETDLRRHFVGEIKLAIGSIARIEGYFVIFDKNKNTFIKKPSQRVTIMDLSSSGYWVNIIPKEVQLADLKYHYNNINNLTITDGKLFELDINEFGPLR
ncbi:MAG: hypothetical protein WBN06_16400 [Lysobacterales bacterium]